MNSIVIVNACENSVTADLPYKPSDPPYSTSSTPNWYLRITS